LLFVTNVELVPLRFIHYFSRTLELL